MTEQQRDDFVRELTQLLNKYSLENDSATPDFILAIYLYECLKAFNAITRNRDSWHGFAPFGRLWKGKEDAL